MQAHTESVDGTPRPVGEGWYVDPWRLAPGRWWDGSRWTGATAGWKGGPLLPPLAEDGRCRVQVHPGSADAPSPAELWRRWEPARRPCLRWWHPHNVVRLAAVALIACTVLVGVPVLVVFFLVMPVGFWQQAHRDACRPLVLVRPGLQGASGGARPRRVSSHSAVSSTECVWWEVRVDRRQRWPGTWRRCWRLTAPCADFELIGDDGALWVHVGNPRRLRPAMVELVRQELDYEGHRYRVVERGLLIDTPVQVTGPIRSSSWGEPVQSDLDQEGWVRARSLFSASPFSVLPGALAAKRRAENTQIFHLAALFVIIAALVAVVWPGILGDAAPPSGWPDAVSQGVFTLVLLGAPILLGRMMLSDIEARTLADDVAQGFRLVQTRLAECEALLAPPSGNPAHQAGAVMQGRPQSAWHGPPSPAEAERLATAIGALDAVLVGGVCVEGDPSLVVARRRLEMAVGHYRLAVIATRQARRRRGWRARCLARRLPEVPPTLPSSPEWA